MSDLAESLQPDVREYLEKQVRSGFTDLRTLPHRTSDVFADEAESATIEDFARATLQDILIDYRAEQRHWPSTTDCDRLDAAFAELDGGGIVARQNFWCCGTCGLAAIGDEIGESRAHGHDVRGYTFYHEQDTDSAIDGQGVYLYYGAIDGVEAHSLEIAREIQDVLRRHELTSKWDGTFGKRIRVVMDWKRRQP